MTHIDAIVSICPLTPEVLYRIDAAGYEHLYLPLDDVPEAPIEVYFGDAYRFIASQLAAGHGVFVHCMAGVSRSATLTLYYLMVQFGMSGPDALMALRSKRCVVRPNDGFLAALSQVNTG